MPVINGEKLAREQEKLRQRLIQEIKDVREEIQRHNKHSNYDVAPYLGELQKKAEKCKTLDNAAVRLAAEKLLEVIKEVQGFRKTKRALIKAIRNLLAALERYAVAFC